MEMVTTNQVGPKICNDEMVENGTTGTRVMVVSIGTSMLLGKGVIMGYMESVGK